MACARGGAAVLGHGGLRGQRGGSRGTPRGPEQRRRGSAVGCHAVEDQSNGDAAAAHVGARAGRRADPLLGRGAQGRVAGTRDQVQHLLMQIRGSEHWVPWDPRLGSLYSNHVHVDDHVSF